MRALALVFAVVAAGCDPGTDIACFQAGCSSGVQFRIAPFPVTAAEGARIELCWNEECHAGAVPMASEMSWFSGPEAALWVWVSRASSDLDVKLDARISAVNELGDFADGDIYRANVRDANGTVLVEQAWSATYEINQPNGSSCPPTCQFDADPEPL